MKTFEAIILYMVIGGVIMGLSHRYHAKTCGTPQPISKDLSASVMVWPAILSFSLFLDESVYKSTITCK